MTNFDVAATSGDKKTAASGALSTSPPLSPTAAVDPQFGQEPVDAGGISLSQRRLMLHMPVDVRSASMALIAVILSLYTLQWAKEIVVPILCGVMMSYALTPIVNRMERWKIPRAGGAALLLCAILGLMGWGAWALGDQTDALIETVPRVTAEVRDLSQRASGQTSTITRVQNAAAELAAAAGANNVASTTGPAASGRSVARQTPAAKPAAEAPASGIDLRGYLLSGTLGLMSFLGKLAVIFFLALFLMSSGNSFRRKMVKLAGPKLSQKKVTIETLDEITEQIQRYLLVQVGVSVVVGVCTWLAFLALGLNNSAVWGVVAAVTNLIPYVGAVLVGVGSGAVALVQFGTPEMALVVAATSFALHTVIGNILTPWWMGRASRMSPVAVFVAVLVFGWLWGVWGLLLGVPILLVIKSVCDRVDDLKPIGELLGA